MKNKVLRILLISVLLIALAACAFACSSASRSNGKREPDNGSAPSSSAGDSGKIVVTEDRLIVYTVNLSLTSPNPANVCSKISEALTAAGGWQESSSEGQNGVYYYTMRVPTAKLPAFVSSVSALGKTNEKTVESYDITERYVNAVAERDALTAKKAALEALLPQATTLDEVLKVTDKIQEVAAEIDRYNRDITGYKNDADYSTVHVTIYKEGVYHEPSYWERLGEVFFGSGKSIGKVFGFFLTVVVALIPYALLAAAAFGLYVLIKYIVCKIKKIPFGLFVQARARRRKRKAELAYARKVALEDAEKAEKKAAALSAPTEKNEGEKNAPEEKQE